MHVSKLDINGNSLVGLYILPLKDVVFVGNEVPKEDYKLLEEIFDAKVISLTIAGTSLIGVFLATDGDKLLVPDVLFEHELEIIEKSGVEFLLMKTTHTCLGNNLVCTRKGFFANPLMEEEILSSISSFLNVPLYLADQDFPTIGSFITHNSKFGLISHDFTDDQVEQFEEKLGLILTSGTVNMGSTQVSSGVAVNDGGFVIGTTSGGPEIMNADQALGFIDN